MTVKFYSVLAIAAAVFIPAVSTAKDMTIQERLDNVRAARALFFELDDIHRSYKRDFAKKDQKQIEIDKKNKYYS